MRQLLYLQGCCYSGCTSHRISIRRLFALHAILVQLQQLELVIAEGVLYSLHQGKYFFFLQSTANHLHTNREAVHVVGIVVLIRAAGDTVEATGVEALG